MGISIFGRWGNLGGRTNGSRRSGNAAAVRRYRPRLELLEDRNLLSASPLIGAVEIYDEIIVKGPPDGMYAEPAGENFDEVWAYDGAEEESYSGDEMTLEFGMPEGGEWAEGEVWTCDLMCETVDYSGEEYWEEFAHEGNPAEEEWLYLADGGEMYPEEVWIRGDKDGYFPESEPYFEEWMYLSSPGMEGDDELLYTTTAEEPLDALEDGEPVFKGEGDIPMYWAFRGATGAEEPLAAESMPFEVEMSLAPSSPVAAVDDGAIPAADLFEDATAAIALGSTRTETETPQTAQQTEEEEGGEETSASSALSEAEEEESTFDSATTSQQDGADQPLVEEAEDEYGLATSLKLPI